MESNLEKFFALIALNLRTNQYAITGSVPLGIRKLKAIQGIGLIVTEKLWDEPASQLSSFVYRGSY